MDQIEKHLRNHFRFDRYRFYTTVLANIFLVSAVTVSLKKLHSIKNGTNRTNGTNGTNGQ